MKKPKTLPSIEYLNECFELTVDGDLIWKERPERHFSESFKGWRGWNKKFSGKSACVHRGGGYKQVCINQIRFKAHRVIYCMYYGADPGSNMIDHIDCDPSNNRPENLRVATPSQNITNSKVVKAVSGYRGVTWNARNAKWEAAVAHNGRNRYLGIFENIEEAALVARKAREDRDGDFHVS